jgi:hypothetical protein
MADPKASPNELALAMLDAMAPVLGLSIDAAWRDGVVANLVTLAAMAKLVQDFPLDEDIEPAPVYRT